MVPAYYRYRLLLGGLTGVTVCRPRFKLPMMVSIDLFADFISAPRLLEASLEPNKIERNSDTDGQHADDVSGADIINHQLVSLLQRAGAAPLCAIPVMGCYSFAFFAEYCA